MGDFKAMNSPHTTGVMEANCWEDIFYCPLHVTPDLRLMLNTVPEAIIILVIITDQKQFTAVVSVSSYDTIN